MNNSTSNLVELLHPIYLDTDMSMAFAAALTGGVALEREEVAREDRSSAVAKNLRGNIRLFDVVGVGGAKESDEAESIGSESRMVRQHTEASLFIALNDELRRTGQFAEVNVETLVPGDLVSIKAGPAIAPLRRVMDQIVRLFDLVGPMVGAESPGEAGETSEMSRQQRREKARQLAKEVVDDPHDGAAGIKQVQGLFLALKEDLDRSGMIDIVVKEEEGAPNFLLTLDTRFLGETALELLHTSKFTIVGKVTEVWPSPDDVVNLHRRSVMSLLPAMSQVATWGTFTFLASVAGAFDVKQMEDAAQEAVGNGPPTADDDPEDEIRFGDDIVALHPALSGPAIQILPLAICA